jgi:hypothetical protein
VNRRGAVERQVGNDPPLHPGDDQGADPDLDHVPPHQEHHAPALPGRAGYPAYHGAQIARGQHVGKAVEEGLEGSMPAGRSGEQ